MINMIYSPGLVIEPLLLTMSKCFFALSLTRAPQMIGILDEADPAGEVYDPAGIDMAEECNDHKPANSDNFMQQYSSIRVQLL
jgi:hypothetical protein